MEPGSRDFVYVPIRGNAKFCPGMGTFFSDAIPRVEKFFQRHEIDLRSMRFPVDLHERITYLDPPSII